MAMPMDFSARSRAKMPFAAALTTPTLTIEPRDDPNPVSGTHAPRIASQQNAFLWNQVSRELLMTLAGQSAGTLQIVDFGFAD
jgi:hypothetical protein